MWCSLALRVLCERDVVGDLTTLSYRRVVSSPWAVVLALYVRVVV